MFTGLIEELGTIKNLSREGSNLHIEVECQIVLDDLKLGDSIALDGVCQTVVKLSATSFTVTAIEETLRLTNFNDYKLGTRINLERCLRLSDRLGGHIVQGHVDGVGEVVSIENRDGSYGVRISFPPELSKYIIHKGSITINGISLTVASIKNLLEKLPDARLARNVKAELTDASMMTSYDERNDADGTLQVGFLTVCIIPTTWEMTNISSFQPGTKVNLEVDVLAKYIEKMQACH